MENIRILRSEYCNIGVFVFFGLVMAGGIVTLALFQIAPALPFDWSFVFAAIWFIVGCAVAYGAYVLLTSFLDRSRAQHDYEIRDEPPREIIREIVKVEPAPALPPPAPPVITRGVRLIYDDKGDFCSWDDVVEFARWIAQGGSWSENFWKGKTLYSGYHIGSTDSWRRFIQLFVKAGIIVGMDAETRKTGKLQVTDLDEMLQILDHAAPAKPTTPPAPQ